LEDQLAAFSRIDCDNAGTGPEEKITCDTLVSAGQNLAKAGREWMDAWTSLLGSLTATAKTPTAEARKSCDHWRDALEDQIRELPGRIE